MRTFALGRIAAAAFVAAVMLSSTRSEAGTGYTCTEIPGYASFSGFTVEPSQPRVGDQVTLEFGVDFRVYSVSKLILRGSEPLLEGETILFAQRQPRFQLQALQAGTTSLTLDVTYETEARCINDDGHMFFQGGYYHTISSQSHELVVAPAAMCFGDCDGDGRVTVDELIRVSMFPLGLGSVDACPFGNLPGDSIIDVDDLVTVINNILNGCP